MNTSDMKPTAHDCCTPQSPASAAVDAATTDSGSKGILAVVGALGAALLASACCWLPLALVAMGASAVGISATFDRWRPVMLGVTAILLAIGFYLAYRPQRCAPGSACATVPPTRRRGMRLGVWIATALVIGVASFPWWSPMVIARLSKPNVHANQAVTDAAMPPAHLTLTIIGMSCAACAVTIRRAVQVIPGVRDASVSFEDKTLTFAWNEADQPRDQLVQRVREVVLAEGYALSPSPATAPGAKPCCRP